MVHSQSKGFAKRTRLQFAAVLACLTAMVFSVPLFTKSDFDPNSVQPSACNPKDMRCGFVPLKARERAAIPQDPSNMIRHRGLPSSVDLSSDMPPIGNQGRQGSCVGWATGYAMKSYHEKVERQWSYGSHVQAQGGEGDHIFSPAYIYNQINRGRDTGSNPMDALRLLQTKGAAPWKAMPYRDNDYRTAPSAAADSVAKNYKIESFKTLDQTNADAIKSQLAAKRVVFIGVKVYDNFYKLGNNVYDQGQGSFRGGHAILLVGYDDSKRSGLGDVGAFKIFNSWGPDWGTNGFGWVSYKGMARVGLGAFAIYDLQDSKKDEPGPGPTPVTEPKVTSGPAAPSSGSASRGSYPNKVYVSWTAVEGAAAYQVERADAGEETFQSIGFAREPYLNDDKVQASVSYRYRVMAIGPSGRSKPDASPVAEGYAQSSGPALPAQVVGLEGHQDARGRVILSWTPVAGATAYEVQRFQAGNDTWRTLGKTRRTKVGDSRPVPNERNSYRVAAYTASGKGQWSSAATVAVAGKETPPGRVTGLAATQGYHKDKVSLTWTAVPGATHYVLFRYNIEARKGVYLPERISGTSFDDAADEVKSGKTYGYFVRGINSAGVGPLSNFARGYSSPGQHRGEILTPPTDVTGVLNESQKTIALRWKAVKGASGYYVFAKESAGGQYKFVAGVGPGATEQTVKISGKQGDQIFSEGKLYLFVIRSKSLFGGESKDSDAVSAFINTERYLVKKRFFGNDGFDKFKGQWVTTEWDGESAPKKVTLSLQRSGQKFEGTLAVQGGATKRFSGTFVAKTSIIESNGFRMNIVDDGVSNVELVEDQEEKRLSFARN